MKVLITPRSFRKAGGEPLRKLTEAGAEAIWSESAHALDAAEMRRRVPGVDGIIAGIDQITTEVMAAADRLKVISRFGVGFDTVDISAATERGIVVTNTPGVNNETVAELALALIFCLARQIPQQDRAMKAGRWERALGTDVAGKTLGIVGLGAIGKSLARKARALGMEVMAVDVCADEQFACAHGVRCVSLEECLRNADFVSLHVPKTSSTENLIGRKELGLMKKGAFLVNTARGEILDEDALYEALGEGRLAGAALDAFRKEPPDPHPLLGMSNVILTPHIGAQTAETLGRMAMRSVENLLAVLHGERPRDVVNPEVYARVGRRTDGTQSK